jgi:hypothetical protein
MKRKSKITLLLLILTLTLSGVYAQNPVVKIDFDQSGRNTSEVGDPDYTSWVVSGVNSASITENGVTFTITRVGTYGNQLGTNWQKVAVQAPNYARLVGDGVTVKNIAATEAAQIELRISGLSSGNHTLLAFLNVVDSETYTYSPIDIFVDGNLVENDAVPSVRAQSTPAAKSVYLNLQATLGNDVVIRFAAETSGTYDFRNVMLNGMELNTPNIFNQATNPIPAHNNEHVELNSGNTLLEWTPALNAVSHNVYFGTSLTSVESATTTSPEYQGNLSQATTSFSANGLYTGETYFWRIDEVSSGGDVTKGTIWRFRPAQLAFPEAEGYGRFARGGRGGKVVVVTNLNDSGPGSLREAVTNDIGPRTIVFNVSGLILLQSRLVSNNPYVTIAGQTAPGKGITIKGSSLGLGSSDNIVQNVRVRLGYDYNGDAGGMGLLGNYNIIDHCSISWTTDEAISSRNSSNVTFQHSLISEALNKANHPNYPNGIVEHGYAASISGNVGSFHHNLLAHNYGRNWSLAGGLDGGGFFAGKLDITNNVVYNWGSRTTDGGANEVNFVGNYYKPGPGMQLQRYALTMDHENPFGGMQRAYFDGNVMPGYFNETNQTYGRRSVLSNGVTINYETFVNTPFFPSYVTTQTADHAYKMVLSNVGCIQPVLDDHDLRMVNETLTGTYSVTGSRTGKKGFPDTADDYTYEDYPFITRPSDWDSDNDGLPNWWETLIGTNVNSPANDFSDTNADTNLDGYTNLDYYLQWMSLPHYSSATGEMISINLQELSRGFTSSPNYQITNVVNGSTNLVSNVLEFTPSAIGFGSFDFTVTDSEGDSMTRKVNVVNGYNLALSVKEIKETTGVKVWPIPNKGSFSIKLKNDVEKSEFKIFDILGKEVLNGFIETATTKDVNLNARGIFILKVFKSSTKEVLHTQKLIIE